MSIISRMRKQTAAWWKRRPETDEQGQFVYSGARSISCRWDDVVEEFIAPDGSQQYSRSIVYVDRVMKVGDVLMLVDTTLYTLIIGSDGIIIGQILILDSDGNSIIGGILYYYTLSDYYVSVSQGGATYNTISASDDNNGVLYSELSTVEQDDLLINAGAIYKSGEDPARSVGAGEVRQFDQSPNLKGTETIYTATL